MEKLYQQREGNPFHISVGAVAVKEGQILVHRRTKENVPERFAYTLGGLSESYVLMHESVENGEALEDAVVRGLKEEFGASGTVRKYLGALSFMHTWSGKTFEKTILYFLADITEMSKRPDDMEAWTELAWLSPEALLEKFRYQNERSDRPELSEAKIIEDYLAYGNS